MSDGKSLRTLLEILLVTAFIALIGFTFTSAMTQYSLVKPLITDFMATPKELKVEIIDFWAGYNPKTNRYDNVTFGIQNVGESEEVSATITIQLYDVNNTIIASGEKELPSTLKVNTNFNVNVELSWVKNATLTDYAKGRIIIS